MVPAPEQTYLSTCPVCQNQVDVTSLEPFTKLKCPFCGSLVRVRRKFDHFIIVRQIGEGGMSRVFEAEDETLGRRVALKILNRQFGRDAARVEQFRQEALITASVNHLNVVKLYSVGYDQGYFYIAMELVAGGSLEQRIRKEGTIKETEALRIGREVAEGLRAAQQMGLIHRDVKPANILFTDTGTAKVVDFGLALFVERGPDSSGEIWATPYYVAPEKVIDHREDYRSDIFSLGATLFHALTGKPPHKANTASIQELRMIKCRRVALEDSGLRFAPRTIHVVNRMLAFRPQERCANYDEAVEELRLAEGLVDQSAFRTTPRKIRWLAGSAAALLLAFVVGWFLRSSGERRSAAITTTVDAAQTDLAAGGTTLQAGRKTVADRFLAARETMLKGQFAEARHQFERIIEFEDVRQPTLNWTRFNAALCSIAIGKSAEAEKHLHAIATDAGNVSQPSLAAFFKTLGSRMGTHLGTGTPVNALGYATNNEEILGYLIQGLAEWHIGNALVGMEELQFFRDHLTDVQSTTESTSIEWILLYAAILTPYERDIVIAQNLQDSPLPNDAEALGAALADLKRTKAKLRTQGTLRKSLDEKEKVLKAELARIKFAGQSQDMAKAKALRQRELDQLAEVTATLPTLVQGYDYSRAIEILRDFRFESSEVKAALQGRLYLYERAQSFLTQLFTDIAASGYKGKLQRREGGVLEGKITAADLTKVTAVLDRGALTVPLESITPESLIEMAQFFAAQITDSSEYYQRLEQIAVFARVAGLHNLSATIAAQLMEENRDFRTRWMKVVQ